MTDREERRVLIQRLTRVHPYPREWFEKLTTAQLIKMYNLPKKKKAPPRGNHYDDGTSYQSGSAHRRYDDETGQWMVKTDGFGWEPESN